MDMKKRLFPFLSALVLTVSLVACGGTGATSSSSKKASSSTSKSSSSRAPRKTIQINKVSLFEEDEKAYVKVEGVENNYTAEDFKWAWGMKEQDGDFVDGSITPSADSYKVIAFEEDRSFVAKYCLTDIENLVSGKFYRVYGGTPESFGEIVFENQVQGASDATRAYYIRLDEDNSLVFDAIQPIKYDKASIVEIKEEDLPTGVTATGAYLKFGGKNINGITEEMVKGWNDNNKIAGNFQRVIPANSYTLHNHVNTERFWKFEDDYFYMYLYVGFLEKDEGWMTHFDLISGNNSANVQLTVAIWGEPTYTIGEAEYKIYADTRKSGDENYWGCIGVYRAA